MRQEQGREKRGQLVISWLVVVENIIEMPLVSWSRPCVLIVFSNGIFVKSEDWRFFSLKLFKIRAWHKALLPIPLCCPPAILILCNDSNNVSFTDVQFVHVLKGDREKKCSLAWQHRRAQACIWWGFLKSCSESTVCQCPSGCNESEIPVRD